VSGKGVKERERHCDDDEEEEVEDGDMERELFEDLVPFCLAVMFVFATMVVAMM